MKKSILATAVATAVGAAGLAHAEATVYGRVNTAVDVNGITTNDRNNSNPHVDANGDGVYSGTDEVNANPITEGGDSATELSTVASRFGIKGETDFGNGLKAFGHYEWGVSSDNEGTSDVDNRIAVVGLEGAFGKVELGNQWSAYNEQFGTYISPTYSLGYYLYNDAGGDNGGGGLFRASNTIQYTNSFGPLNLGLDVRLDENGDEGDNSEAVHGDGWGIAANWKFGNFTIAAAYDQEGGHDRAERKAADQVGFAGAPAQAARTTDLTGTDAAARAVAEVAGQFNRYLKALDVSDNMVEVGVFGAATSAERDTFQTALRAWNVIANGDTAATAAQLNTAITAAKTYLDAIEPGALRYAADNNGNRQLLLTAEQHAELLKFVDAYDGADVTASTDIVAIDGLAATGNYAEAVTAAPADEAPDTTRTGVALKGEFGNYWASLGWQNYQVDDDKRDTDTEDEKNVDTVTAYIGGSLGEKNSWLLGYSTSEIENDGNAIMVNGEKAEDPTQVTWGFYRNSGGGLRLYYEGSSVDDEVANRDGARHLLGMRFDF